MWDVLLILLCAGVGVALIIICVYLAICFINRKLGLDTNGRPLHQMQQQQIHQVDQKPQVIKIELMGGSFRNMDDYTGDSIKTHISDDVSAGIKMVDIVSDMKVKKVETTFENKRIGKVEQPKEKI